MVPLRILAIDDDPAVLLLVKAVLEPRGHKVYTAGDGEKGFHAALELQPDLIVTDVMMPGMDGFTLVRRLRAVKEMALVPVVFLTALSSDEDRLRGFRLGADDYLSKPFRVEEFDVRIGNAIRRRQAIDASVGRMRRTTEERPAVEPASGVRGSLAEFGLPALMSLVEMERKSGILKVSRQGQAARVFFSGGKPVAARIDDGATGAEAIYRLIGWADGRFEFHAVDVEMNDEVGLSTTHLLLEGARRIDEQLELAHHRR